MSQENVEIVKATLTAMNRGDWQAAFKAAARDAEIDLSASGRSGPGHVSHRPVSTPRGGVWQELGLRSVRG